MSVLLGEASARVALEGFGIPFVAQVTVPDHDSVAEAHAALGGGPVVLKVAGDVVLHKTEAGFVELDLATPDAALAAYDRLVDRAEGSGPFSIVMQEMVPAGLDVFVGLQRDETFGPLLIVGSGGTEVELWRDVARSVLPVEAKDVLALLESSRVGRVAAGFRGGPVYDLTGVAELAVALSQATLDGHVLDEVDLNPVRVLPDGRTIALDARLAARPVDGPAGGADRDRRPDPTAVIARLLAPTSVAVVGASDVASKPGAKVLAYLAKAGFPGSVHAVNPRGEPIGTVPTVASVEDLPVVPDVAVVAVPAERVVAAVGALGERGVPAAIVLSSGFAEVGPAGARLEQELVEVARRTGIRIVGPNTIGIVNAEGRASLTFSQALEATVRPGAVSMIAQSGAVSGSLVSRVLDAGRGFRHWVAVGNEADLGVADFVRALAADDGTGAIALYLEGTRDGADLRDALAAARAHGVPVVAFKAGRSEAGGVAVASHSGALAGSADAYAAVFARERVVAVGTVTQLLDVAQVLAVEPATAGRGVAVLTTSGGVGSIVVDELSERGMALADLAPATRSALQDALPAFAAAANPVDLTGQGTFVPGTVRRCLEALGADDAVDAIVVALTSVADPDAVRVAQEVLDGRPAGTPTLVTWLLAPPLAREGRRLLGEAGTVVFDEPADAVEALAALRSKLEEER